MQLVLIRGVRHAWRLQQVCAHTLMHNHAYVMMPHKVSCALTLHTCMHSLATVCAHTCMTVRFSYLDTEPASVALQLTQLSLIATTHIELICAPFLMNKLW